MLEGLEQNTNVVNEEDWFADFQRPVETKELPPIKEEATQQTTTNTDQQTASSQILQATSEIKTTNDASSKIIASTFDGLTNMICNMIAGTDDTALYGMTAEERKELENAIKLVMPQDKVFGGKWFGLALVGVLQISNKAQKCYKQRKIQINRIQTTQEQEQQNEAQAAEMQNNLQNLYYEKMKQEIELQAKEDAKQLAKQHEKEVKESINRVEANKDEPKQPNKPPRKRRGQIGN